MTYKDEVCLFYDLFAGLHKNHLDDFTKPG